ncbi:MAG TPA: transketolase C-terminal domain-containing protein [Terriglobia bacterium]|nr:transketolase C-terminal domain-containing protein [Terriglobia bacterium]
MSTTSLIKIRTGNQMIAEGALHSGCMFFAGYPITPASGIYKTMIEELPKRKGVAISSPDEISALAYCVGASARGVKSMTATSGPGWSLMIETVQYALMTELPVVIALVQRLGPSTGGATQGAQGDVLFAEFCTSGGYTVPIFAPSTPKECFEVTTAAMYWAEKLRTPVVILSDKEIGMMAEDIDFNSLRSYAVNERTMFTDGSAGQLHYHSYEFTSADDIPAFVPVGGEFKTTITGSAHDKKGRLQKNSPETIDVLRHLQEKIDVHASEMAMLKMDDQDDADILLISFGITARTSIDAVHEARRAGKRIRFINVISLFPVPEYHLTYAAKGTHTVLVAEENFSGQYRSVISRLFPDKEVRGINSLGRMITPGDILEALP